MTMQKMKCMTLTDAHHLIFRCMMAAEPMRDYMMSDCRAAPEMDLFGDDDYCEEQEERAIMKEEAECKPKSRMMLAR